MDNDSKEFPALAVESTKPGWSMKSKLALVLSAVLILVTAVWLGASPRATLTPLASPVPAAAVTPTVGTLSVTPSIVGVNTPTQVTFTIQITDPTLLPGGVNLLRVDSTGKTIAILGQMYDDGTHGDATAGDKTFSLSANLNESATGQAYFQASAAFKGLLRRVPSTTIPVAVWKVVSNDSHHFSLYYPPAMIVTSLSSDQLAFGPAPIAPDTDQQGLINLLVVAADPNTLIQQIRGLMKTPAAESVQSVDGEIGTRIIGTLSDNVFGHGGQSHGYVVVAHNGETFQFDYDASDPLTSQTFEKILITVRFH